MLSANQAKDVWNRAVEQTRRRSPASFEQWFSGVQLEAFDDGRLALTARDEFVRDWVKAHFLPDLLANLHQLLGVEGASELEVSWQISGELNRPICNTVTRSSSTHPPPPSERRTRPPDGGPSARVERRSERPRLLSSARAQLIASLNPKYTFANFVVGPSNELAHAASFASAGGGGPRYNPLFIAGGTGLGKTHLMHAIAHKVLDERPEARVVYVSAERFTNEFIEALQHHAMDEFRARYRTDCDLLLLDDIQFLAGREQTQEEFFHTFNALREADRPIVVTSDKYPHQLQRMPERLVSRFTSGLVADIQVPQLETRVAIVRKKAQLEGIPLSDEVAVLLAQSVRSNVRELEGALIRLAAKSSLTGRLIDVEFTKGEIAMVSSTRPDVMSVEDIQRAVCSHFRLSNAELLSKDRHKSVAFARQVAMYLCRQRLKCSFPELGRAFGNRDHTTVMSAVRRVEALRQRDPQVNAHLEAIEQKLAGSDD
ncbi:MAG TPA: chromosomal replication initiator protein DnaA [Polyangiaceae bacterium]